MKLYFIAILPPEDIRRQIKDFKMEIALKYGAKHALKLPAHITLKSPFKLVELQEKNLIDNLKIFAEAQPIFDLKLSGFGSFPPKVIFVNVEHKAALINLHKGLYQYFSSIFQFSKDEKSFNPHITIATRDLSPGNFTSAWEHFQNKEYQGSFQTNSISLLKHDGKNWNDIEDFELKEV